MNSVFNATILFICYLFCLCSFVKIKKKKKTYATVVTEFQKAYWLRDVLPNFLLMLLRLRFESFLYVVL